MTPDVLLVRADRLFREDHARSDLVRALGHWLDFARGAVWHGNWEGADSAVNYVRAIYMELVDGSVD